ncbi:MAG: choice-of-anchor D domain-containing protein, partial [Candidatus Kapabacteria bacterium]|nr:choice-of-anchor D domain-containing protein [Candidatus Kapabacteria bacterium]
NITLQLDGNAITLSQTSFQLSNVRGNDSVTFSCTARATSPYFIRDTVTAFVTMTSGTYVNYQTILLTVDLQTENTYSSTLSDVNITWRAAHARPPVAFWAVGKASQNRNAVLRGSTIDSTSIPDDVQCVFGLSNLSGMVGTTNSRIYRTTNGSTWSPVVVSSITSTVRGINFFDNSNGICIGVPAGGVWNTGVSNNGGQSWSVGTPLPAPAGLESTLAAAIAWQGNNGWVGTTLGRVFRTNDKGASWKEAIVEGGKAITQLSFANDKLGFALVRNSSSVTDPASVYHSTDGGATWAATGYVFNVSGLHPVAAYSPVNSKQFLATCSGSQVMMSLDSGRTWQPTPTGFGINAAAGFGLTSSNTATLYILGRNIGTLRLPLVADQRREIVLTATTLAFDSVDVGTSKTLSTQSVRNTSTLPVRLDSISIIPEAGTNAGEFRIAGTFSLPRTINPSESATIPVIFRPDATGERKATLRTKSDASNGDQTMLLIGNGRSTNTSVDEQRGGVSVTLYPQPVSTDATLHLRNAAGLALRCEILTLNGTLALPRIEGIATTDQTQLPVTVDALPPGVYIYRVTLGGTLHTGTFTIVR